MRRWRARARSVLPMDRGLTLVRGGTGDRYFYCSLHVTLTFMNFDLKSYRAGSFIARGAFLRVNLTSR